MNTVLRSSSTCIHARISGSILRVTTLRSGYPPKLSPIEESAKRAKRHLRDKCDSLLCYAYQSPMRKHGWGLRFITLTFRPCHEFDGQPEDVQRDFMASALKAGCKRIKRLIKDKGDFAYIAVPEKGKLYGRYHYHLIAFMPFIHPQVLMATWGNGYIDEQTCKDSNIEDINNLYSYLCKYMGKGLEQIDSGCFGKKRYHSSRNIRRMVCNIKYLVDEEKDMEAVYRIIARNVDVKWVSQWDSPDKSISFNTISVSPDPETISKTTDILRSCI